MKFNYPKTLLALVTSSLLAVGCGSTTDSTFGNFTNNSGGTSPAPNPSQQVLRVALAATTNGIDAFPINASGIVGAPTLFTTASLANGVRGLALVPGGTSLVAVTGSGANTQLQQFGLNPVTNVVSPIGNAVTIPNLSGAITVDANGRGAAGISGGGGGDTITSFLLNNTGVVLTGASTVPVSAAVAGPNPVYQLTIGFGPDGTEFLMAGDSINSGGSNIGNIDRFIMTAVANQAPTLGAATPFSNGVLGSRCVTVSALNAQAIFANNLANGASNGTNGGAITVPPSGAAQTTDAGDQPITSSCLAVLDGLTVGVITDTDANDPDIYPYILSGNTITNFANVHLANDGRLGTNVSNAGVDDPTASATRINDSEVPVGSAILPLVVGGNGNSSSGNGILLVLSRDQNVQTDNLSLSAIPINPVAQTLGFPNKQTTTNANLILDNNRVGQSGNLLTVGTFAL